MRLVSVALLSICSASVSLAATAQSDRVTAYRALVQQDLRLAIVSHRIVSANTPFCKNRTRNPGWVLHDERQYPDHNVARAAFGFRQPVSVSAVVPGGPADQVGIKPGDGLVALDEVIWAWNSDDDPKQSALRIEAVQKAVQQGLAKGAAKLTLDTATGIRTVVFEPNLVCASHFWVDASSKLDAGADGKGVRITEGIMLFTRDDDAELAAVVSHELAHNLLGHRARLNAAKRSTKEILATEIEADRLSVWLMANAGYDPIAALRFAERYGRKTGLGIFSDGTHLRWKNRKKVMQAEIDLMSHANKIDGLLAPPLLSGD